MIKGLIVREYDKEQDKDWLELSQRIAVRLEKRKGRKVLFFNSKYPLKDIDLLAWFHGYKVVRIMSVLSAYAAFVVVVQN